MNAYEEEEITVVEEKYPHEEKYPIRFSLSQFILLLGVEVVVLSLVFLLGARFGSGIFPHYPQEAAQANRAFQVLAPDSVPAVRPVAPAADKLVDTPLEEGGTAAAAGEEEAVAEGEEEADALPAVESPVQANKSLFHNPGDKNTLIRFKSSGNTRFAIEVGKYFDEVLAAREITKLKAKGYEAYLVIDNASSASPSYGVRVGSFAERKIADDYAAKMSNDQGLELRVVQVD